MKFEFSKLNIANIVLSILVYFFGLYLLTNNLILGSNPTGEQSFSFFILLFMFCLLFFFILIALNVIKKNYKPSYILLCACLFIFIIGIINYLTMSLERNFSFNDYNGNIVSFSYVVSDTKIFQYRLSFFILILLFFFTMDVVPKIFKKFDIASIYALIFLTFVVVLAVISYFIEGSNYINFLKNLSSENPYVYAVKSLFVHRNNYGIILFGALCSSLYLHSKTKKFYWFIFDIFFLINMFFTLCKTGLVLSILLNVAYLVMRFCLSYKEHKKRNLISLASICGLCAIFIVGVITILIVKGKFNSFLDNFFSKNVFRTIESRFILYKNAVDVVMSTNIVTGAGYKVFNDILFNINGYTTFSHNGVLELFGTGGIILVTFSILFVIYFIYHSFKDTKTNKNDALFGLILMFVCLIYTMFESGSILFASTSDYMYLSILIFVPLLQKHPISY